LFCCGSVRERGGRGSAVPRRGGWERRGITQVADPVAVRVALVGVEFVRAIVEAVVVPVAVEVEVTGVADAVTVGVTLVGVGGCRPEPRWRWSWG